MNSKNSGSSLVAVMIAVTFFTAIIGVVMNVTRTQSSNTHRAYLHSQAVAYGDAVLESLFDQWRNSMMSATTADDRYNGRTNAYLSANLHEPTTANVPPPNGITLTNWSVVSATPMLKVSTREDGRPDPEQGTNSRLRIRLYYLARVQVAFTGPGVNDSVTLERPFVRGGRNLFDNFFFGTQPETEFHPGAEMYVDGTVYVGGNLYTAHDFLHFLTDVTYLGTHTINYRPLNQTTGLGDPRYGTDPTIDNAPSLLTNNWDTTKPPRQGSEQKLFDAPTDKLDPKFLDDPIANDVDSDGNANNNGYHELIEQPKPGDDPLKLDPSTSERLSQNADYLIVVDKDNNLVVQKLKEDPVTKELKPEALGTSSDEYKAIQGAVTLDTAVKDVRQGDNTRLVTLDIGKVKTASDTGKISDNIGSGDGLLIYVVDTSVGTSVSTKVKNSSTGATTNVTSAKARGVKLVNGAKLPAGGLTIATPHPAYIQGDYNSGKTSTTQPASNTASSYTPPNDKPSSTVPGYERAPSAVAADAVNILSNAWNDANSLTAQSTRVASNTTVNTAIISGNVPSTKDSYSGGIENFVRFHENWGGKYYTIYGTLASLFNSQQATQPWSKADYSPPNRRWYYDTHFQDNNPPGFKVAREYVRGTWTIR